MRAMRLEKVGQPLVMRELPDPQPSPRQILVRVEACAVCRTDLHVIDGELPPLLPAVTPGHEIVGIVEAVGDEISIHGLGARVGVGWLGSACQACYYCRHGRENLCDQPEFMGYSRDGGFATHVVAEADYAYVLPASPTPPELAPLLCAGLIGWRSLAFAGEKGPLGLYGFGAAAHIVLQVARWQNRRVFAFIRHGDTTAQQLALQLGAEWVGVSGDTPPVQLEAAIIYAPVGELVPLALKQVRRGGSVVCAGIHMSDIPSFPYRDLWGERQIRSVANLTRQDAHDFLGLAPHIALKTHTQTYALHDANKAIEDLRAGRVQGAAVLLP